MDNIEHHDIKEFLEIQAKESFYSDQGAENNKKMLQKRCTVSNALLESHLLCNNLECHENRILLKEEKYYEKLKENFDNFSPLVYLSKAQRNAFLENIKFYKFEHRETLYTRETSKDFYAFILLEGEVVFSYKNQFLDLIDYVNLFGYDGPIFQKRLNTATVEKNSIVGFISEKTFLENLIPFSKFCTFISRSIINRDKVLDHLSEFKNFVLQKTDQGTINIKDLVSHYTKINSCLHPKANSNEIDFSAWFYALHRLPENALQTFVFILLNKPPKILLTNEVEDKFIPKILTKGRNRQVHQYLDGKTVVVVREMETDVLDFVSNSCINYIECKKIREKINDPITLGELYENKDDFEKVCEILGKAISHDFDHGVSYFFCFKIFCFSFRIFFV